MPLIKSNQINWAHNEHTIAFFKCIFNSLNVHELAINRSQTSIIQLISYFDLTGRALASLSRRLLASSNCVIVLGGVSSGMDGSCMIGWLGWTPPWAIRGGTAPLLSAEAERLLEFRLCCFFDDLNRKRGASCWMTDSSWSTLRVNWRSHFSEW